MRNFSQVEDATQPMDVPRALRSWRIDDFSLLIGTAVAAVSTTWVIYTALTPASGKTGFFVIAYVAFLLLYVMTCALELGKQNAFDNLWTVLTWSAALLLLAPLTTILLYVIVKGFAGLNLEFFTADLSSTGTLDSGGGAAAAIIGTLQQVLIAVLISVPLGILTAVYLNEVKGKFRRPVRMFVDAMSGIPSIVAGLFILSSLVYPITKELSGMMGSFALTILMIPTIARTAEEMLRLIPNDLREAGVALGATQWRTVSGVVLPAAKSGLVTAIILGVARIIGETAPLLLVTGGGDALNVNPTSGPMGSLPYYIWKAFLTGGTEEAFARAWGGMLVLLIFIFILFGLARYLSGRRVS